MTLKKWADKGWLHTHELVEGEIEKRLGLVERDIEKSKLPGLGADWSFNIAYNAILSMGSISLAACGYRAGAKAHHYRIIKSLEFTIGMDAETIRVLDSYRSKRNKTVYEESGLVSEKESQQIISLAEEFLHELKIWLESKS